jgi:hypothetical protein
MIFFNAVKRNKPVYESLLCFVCAVADLSSRMTPLALLFQHCPSPHTHIFFFLNSISFLIIWLEAGEWYPVGTPTGRKTF